MKQKLLSLFAALLLGAGAMYGLDPYERYSGTCGADGDNLTWSYMSNKVLIISGTGAMAEYEYDSKIPWYGVIKNEVEKIVVEPGVTTLCKNAFYGCMYLKSVTLPEGLLSIGAYCFSTGWDLQSITLPSTLQTIGDGAFEYLPLTSLTIPASVTSIGKAITGTCNKLETIVVEAGNKVYDSRENCNAIIEKETKTLIAGCKATVIPDGVEVIAEAVFNNISALESATIPASVDSIGIRAFSYCTGLKSITCYAETPPAVDENNCDNIFNNGAATDIPVYVPASSIDAYKAACGWSNFTNFKAIGTDERIDLEIRFTTEETNIEVGQEFDLSTILSARAMLSNLTWTSSDERVATVDEYGRVLGVKEGETTIRVSYPGNDDFLPGKASIKVIVAGKEHLVILNTKVTDSNCNDIFGDGKASYNPKTTTLTLSNLEADADGNDFIRFEQEVPYFNININGKCAITNTRYGIASPGYCNMLITGGELTLSGSMNQIEAYDLILDKTNVTLTSSYGHGKPALLAMRRLVVRTGTHVLAKSTKLPDAEDEMGGLAIATLYPDFGDYIDILTPHVHYFQDLTRINWPGTYYTDDDNNEWAREVELGKTAGRLSDVEPTRIDFTDEESNAVIFSSTAEDWYDPKSDVLVLTSTVTDEQVNDALANLVPGSASWMRALPGSLALYLPAGKGKLSVECQTFKGFTLNIKIKGEEVIRVNQTAMGQFIVDYDLTTVTIVEIYLTASGESPAPARIATSAQDADAAGAYIKSITVTPTIEACSDDRQGTCGDNLNWLLTCDGKLVITGSGAMTDFGYSNRAPWTNFASEITSVSLPKGLTHVGAWSIYQIPNIESVVIPEGVTSIGYVALSGCRKLKEISLPNSLESIASMAFSTAAVKTLVIPANVSSIGEGITDECESLETLVVAEGNKNFDSREDCNAVIKTATDVLVAGCKTTVIPFGVKAIGNMAFSNNGKLGNIHIPASVESIGDYAFQYCSGFTALTIPSSLTQISGSAFTGCKFATINVVPGNPRFDSRDNCNAIIETETNTLVKGCDATVMPEGITAFGEGAFMSNKNLKFISIPASVERLDKNALIYCNKLEAITCYAIVPPTADALAFNYGNPSDISINPEIPVYVPAASIAAYQADSRWSYFHNFVALDGYFTIKALATHGVVTGTGTYVAGAQISLKAIADEGFEFLEWTDGTDANPKELTVTKDETVRALFKMKDAEEIITQLMYKSDVMELTWDKIDEATIYIISLYKEGKLIATYKTTDQENVLEINTPAPARLKARRSPADEQPGKIAVKISGLELGQDYSYNIDAYNDAEEVVNVIAGSFNTAEVATSIEQSGSDINAPIKMLRDGKLIIALPNGKRYDATGRQVQ